MEPLGLIGDASKLVDAGATAARLSPVQVGPVSAVAIHPRMIIVGAAVVHREDGQAGVGPTLGA